MGDLAKLTIWDDPSIRSALSWYLDVAENRRPAKFRIAATVATQLDLTASSEDALWVELDRLTRIFLARWQAIRAGAALPQAAEGPSLLELCRELAYRMLAHCNFCPWNCRVDRVAGAKFGACKLASVRASVRISITRARSCSIAARKAQARSFSLLATCDAPSVRMGTSARTKTTARRRTRAHWRRWPGRCVAHNINWVGGEGVIHLHAIVDAITLLGRDFTPTQVELKRARKTKADRFFWFDAVPDAATYGGTFNAPMLWNSNFFMTLESMKILRVLTDVWLPDFKFGPGR